MNCFRSQAAFVGLVLVGLTLALPIHAQDGPDLAERFSEGAVEHSGRDYRFRLLQPKAVASGGSFPLVVFLHGVGERGSDNLAQLRHLPELMVTEGFEKKFPCFLLAPQCPKDDLWTNQDWKGKKILPLPAESNAALAAVIVQIQRVLKDNPSIDRNRIYLTGLSMGGCGAWELAMRKPEWFAALAPVCGGADPQQAKRLLGMPIWAFHGDQDDVVVTDWSRDMIAALWALDARPAPRYTEYQGVGHGSWDRAYQGEELLPWLFKQFQKPAEKIGDRAVDSKGK